MPNHVGQIPIELHEQMEDGSTERELLSVIALYPKQLIPSFNDEASGLIVQILQDGNLLQVEYIVKGAVQMIGFQYRKGHNYQVIVTSRSNQERHITIDTDPGRPVRKTLNETNTILTWQIPTELPGQTVDGANLFEVQLHDEMPAYGDDQYGPAVVRVLVKYEE
jgi:hypothetical protein